jgi:hypothetical protein
MRCLRRILSINSRFLETFFFLALMLKSMGPKQGEKNLNRI